MFIAKSIYWYCTNTKSILIEVTAQHMLSNRLFWILNKHAHFFFKWFTVMTCSSEFASQHKKAMASERSLNAATRIELLTSCTLFHYFMNSQTFCSSMIVLNWQPITRTVDTQAKQHIRYHVQLNDRNIKKKKDHCIVQCIEYYGFTQNWMFERQHILIRMRRFRTVIRETIISMICIFRIYLSHIRFNNNTQC